LFTGCLEDSGQHMRCTTFSVGAGNMHSWKMILWLIQQLAKFPDIGEILPNSSIPYPLKHRKTVEEKINGLSISHDIQVDNHKMGQLF
jgi:hypothetical protein